VADLYKRTQMLIGGKLVMAMAGRRQALDDLEGPGVAQLAARTP
jgi:hypothetical protein